MIELLPPWISVLFLATSLLTIGFFYYANGKPKTLLFLIILWSALHSILAYSGFYKVTDSIPPRFGLVLVPAVLIIIYGLLPKQQKWIFEKRNTKISTFLHVVRLPVELVLYALFIHKMVPELMTFEGRNYDILMGITAPIMGWLLLKNIVTKYILLLWNMIGLVLVLFILVNGILSAELPFQQFGFDQPNRGVMYFPFILLPATVVPIVIWTHLSDSIKLIKEIKTV
ncbi:hypothetical protein [Maribacter sp. R77961]|uniref:hypothetical protein n=1 Tax=Maribacter sp. R77961 TaxID=3093871 RepID=UPI0037C59832